MQNERIIIGIDPGTQVMGYGILKVVNNKPQMEAMGALKLNRYEDHYLRLAQIYQHIISLIVLVVMLLWKNMKRLLEILLKMQM